MVNTSRNEYGSTNTPRDTTRDRSSVMLIVIAAIIALAALAYVAYAQMHSNYGESYRTTTGSTMGSNTTGTGNTGTGTP
jgi:hypothetical protein